MSTLSLQDIADLAHVQRPVVSMWRARPRVRGREIPFPQPVTSSGGLDRFDRDEIIAWLEATGRGNNREARQDAPALSVPDGTDLEDVVTLLCLYVLTREELDSLDPEELLDRARQVDPDDRLLLRETRTMPVAPHLLRYVDDLVEASFGVPDALARLQFGRLKREAGDRGLSDDLVAVVRAAVAAGRAHLGEDAVLAPPADHRLARGLTEGFTSVLLDGDDPASRALRRRAVIGGIEVVGDARAAVRVLSVVGEPGIRALDAADDLVVSLGHADVGVVIGPASLLCDRVLGEAERLRAETLRTGRLAMAVRLPRGHWKAAHRQSLGLWVLDGGREATSIRVADLASVRLDLDDFSTDVAAALQLTEHRAYRYARRMPLAPILTGSPVVPRGVAAVPHASPAAISPLDRIHVAALRTNEPVRGFDVVAASTMSHLVPRRRSLGELHGGRLIEMRRGRRIDLSLADPAGTVAVLSLDGSTDGVRFDPFDADQRYPDAARTEAGDVIFAERPRPAARVDARGGALVASPARILRLRSGAPLGPHTLAAIINELVPPSSEWRTWTVPELLPAEAEALEAALSAATDHLAELRRHERAARDLITGLIEGVAAGAITLDPTITTRAG